MRKLFGDLLRKEMDRDPNLWLLAGDVGYGILPTDQPNFRNIGAAEQLMIGAAVGLAYEGKTVVCFAITPHLLLRPAEWIRNYLGKEDLAPGAVKLVGAGRDRDYGNLGYTHWCEEDVGLLHLLAPRVRQLRPSTDDELRNVWSEFMLPVPTYLNLRR